MGLQANLQSRKHVSPLASKPINRQTDKHTNPQTYH